MDLKSGARMHIAAEDDDSGDLKTWTNLPMRVVRGLF